VPLGAHSRGEVVQKRGDVEIKKKMMEELRPYKAWKKTETSQGRDRRGGAEWSMGAALSILKSAQGERGGSQKPGLWSDRIGGVKSVSQRWGQRGRAFMWGGGGGFKGSEPVRCARAWDAEHGQGKKSLRAGGRTEQGTRGRGEIRE